jgi:hypothetical protein
MLRLKDTRSIFRDLLQEIQKIRPEYISSLGEGLTIDHISDQLNIQPIPEEIIAIYSCVSGSPLYASSSPSFSDLDGSRLWDFIPGYGLIRLNDINQVIHSALSFKAEEPDYEWELGWIPFLADFSGNYYCINRLNKNQTIICVDNEIGCSICSQNMNSFLLATLECYKQNVFFVDEDGWLDCNDYELQAKIFRNF